MTAALAVAVTVYGAAGALASILQLRRIRSRRSSRDVSLGYLAVVDAGYLLWLAYGVAIDNLPLILVDALGAVAMSLTISVAVRTGRPAEPRRRRFRQASPESGAPARARARPASPLG